MYIKTNWVDNTTPINSTNMNKIEQGIYDNSLVADAVNNVVKPNDETYKDVEITEGQITDVLGVNDVLIKGQALQDGEPTPDSPVDVNVVSGSNVISTSNKNLLDVSSITTQTLANVTITNNGDGSLTLNGTSNSTGALKDFLIKISLKRNITYTFSKGIFVSGSYYVLSLRDSSSTVIANSALDSGVKYVNFTPQSDVLAKYLRLYIAPNKTFTNYTIRPMLEISSATTPYELHQGKELPLDLPVENLFSTTWEQGTLDISNGTPAAASNAIRTTDFISIKPNVNYCISRDIATNYNIYFFYDSSKNFLGRHVEIDLTSSLSTKNMQPNNYSQVIKINTNNVAYMKISDVSNNLSTKYMIEVGSKANAYTPYGTTPLELCKIGTYQDYFYKENNKWYLHKETEKIILGDYNWTLSNNTSIGNINTNRWVISKSCERANNANNSIICNILPRSTAVNTWDNDTLAIAQSVSQIIIRMPIAYTTAADIKTALQNLNAYSIALKTTPTDTEITDTTLISQLEAIYNAPLYEQTNITQTNNDLPVVLDITACKDNINGIKAWIRK